MNIQTGQSKLPTIKALGAAALINTLALNPFNALEAQEVSFQKNQEINKALAQDSKKARHYPNPKIQKYYQKQLKAIKSKLIKYEKSTKKLKANDSFRKNFKEIVAIRRHSIIAESESKILKILSEIGFEKINKEPSSKQKKKMSERINFSQDFGSASITYIKLASSINSDELRKFLKDANSLLKQYRRNPTISNAEKVSDLAQKAYQCLEIKRKYIEIIYDMWRAN